MYSSKLTTKLAAPKTIIFLQNPQIANLKTYPCIFPLMLQLTLPMKAASEQSPRHIANVAKWKYIFLPDLYIQVGLGPDQLFRPDFAPTKSKRNLWCVFSCVHHAFKYALLFAVKIKADLMNRMNTKETPP